MLPSQISIFESKIELAYPVIDRLTAAITFDSLSTPNPKSLVNAGTLNTDPLIEIPPGLLYKTMILHIYASASAVISVGTDLRNLTAKIQALNYITSASNTIKIDGSPLQYTLKDGYNRLGLSQNNVSRIDLSQMDIITSIDMAYNTTTWPPNAGANHYIQSFINCGIELIK